MYLVGYTDTGRMLYDPKNCKTITSCNVMVNEKVIYKSCESKLSVQNDEFTVESCADNSVMSVANQPVEIKSKVWFGKN